MVGRDHRHTAGVPSPKTGVISTEPANGCVATRPVEGSPQTGKWRVRAVVGLNFLLVLRSGRCRSRRPSGSVSGKSRGLTSSALVASSAHDLSSRAYTRRYSWLVAKPHPSCRPLALRLTTIVATKCSSPNTSSRSSRRCATSLSSMLTKIAAESFIVARAAISRGRIIATHAACRVCRPPCRKSSAYAKSLPVLYGGSM